MSSPYKSAIEKIEISKYKSDPTYFKRLDFVDISLDNNNNIINGHSFFTQIEILAGINKKIRDITQISRAVGNSYGLQIARELEKLKTETRDMTERFFIKIVKFQEKEYIADNEIKKKTYDYYFDIQHIFEEYVINKQSDEGLNMYEQLNKKIKTNIDEKKSKNK